MFIRRTQTRSTPSGQTYFTHRLVRSHRSQATSVATSSPSGPCCRLDPVGGRSPTHRVSQDKVRQQTLGAQPGGRHLSIPRHLWPCCAAVWIRSSAVRPLLPEASTALEEEAQRMAARLLEGEADVTGTGGEASSEDLQTVEVGSVELTRPRSVGVEQVGCWALEQLGLGEPCWVSWG